MTTPALEIESLCRDIEDIATTAIGHILGDMLEESNDEHGVKLIPAGDWPEPWAALWALQEAQDAAKRAREHLARLINTERSDLDYFEAMADAASY